MSKERNSFEIPTFKSNLTSFKRELMASKAWVGEQELQKALQDLCGQTPVSSIKVKHVVATANKYFSDFKMVVYEIEKFIKKSNTEDKLGGIYVIDALCRQHSKEKDTFVKRFSIRLKETFDHLRKLSSKDKTSLKRIVDEWRKKDVFTHDVLASLKMDSASDFSSSSTTTTNSYLSTVDDMDDSMEGLLEKLSNNDKQQPQQSHTNKTTTIRKSTTTAVSSSAAVEVKKAVKLCPFRDGNCPFSDKCRFSHFEANTLEQYAARYTRPKRKPSLVLTASNYQVPQAILTQLLCSNSTEVAKKSWSELVVSVEQEKVSREKEKEESLVVARKRTRYDFIPCSAMTVAPPMYELSKTQFAQLLSSSSTTASTSSSIPLQ